MTRLKGLCRFTVTDPLQRVLAEIFLGGPCDDVHSYPLGVSALFSSTCISSGVPISLMNRSARSRSLRVTIIADLLVGTWDKRHRAAQRSVLFLPDGARV